MAALSRSQRGPRLMRQGIHCASIKADSDANGYAVAAAAIVEGLALTARQCADRATIPVAGGEIGRADWQWRWRRIQR